MSRLLVAVALAILPTVACAPVQPLAIAWQPFSAASTVAGKGDLVLSLAFGAGTGETPMPAAVAAIHLQVSGPQLSQPIESWLRNAASISGAPMLHIAQLAPGSYSLTLTLYDQSGAEFGSGSTTTNIQAQQTQHVRLLMTYDLGSTSSNLTLNEAAPTNR